MSASLHDFKIWASFNYIILILQLPLSPILHRSNQLFLNKPVAVVQLVFLVVLKTSSLSLSDTHTHTLWGCRGHHTLSLTLLFLAGSCGREERVTGSVTSRALLAVIGVQEAVEAAGYNWTAARNLCGWLSKPRSPFHWPSQLLLWYKASHHPATDTATSISLQNVVCVCVCVCECAVVMGGV